MQVCEFKNIEFKIINFILHNFACHINDDFVNAEKWVTIEFLEKKSLLKSLLKAFTYDRKTRQIIYRNTCHNYNYNYFNRYSRCS